MSDVPTKHGSTNVCDLFFSSTYTYMFIQLLLLASLCKLYASPIDSNCPMSHDADNLASRLPLSELEVVTLGFAGMNAIIYWLWWYKPQGVSIPIPIHFQFPDGHGSDSREATADHDAENSAPSGSNSREPSGIRSTPFQEQSVTDAQVDETKQSLCETMEDTTAQELSAVETAALEESFEMAVINSQPLADGQDESSASSILTKMTLSIKFWSTLESFIEKIFTVMTYPFVQLFHMIADDTIPYGAMQVPMFYSYEFALNDGLMTAVCVIGALFGGVHFFPWASMFPSHAEQIVWRVSALTTTALPLVLLLVVLSEENDWTDDIPDLFRTLLLIAISAPYVLARIALLTVALLSLRALPQGVFVQISWTSFIPHF